MPVILANNEENVGDYDWKDILGEQYHFPNQYRNKLEREQGKTFINL